MQRRAPSAVRRAESLEEAMSRFADGEEWAFADVYRLAAPHLYGALLRMCREPALAEDLMQDTFVRMHQARACYRKGSSVLAWACTIGRRLYIDTKRHRRREVSEAESPEEGVDSPAPDAAQADEELAARGMALTVERALAALPPRQAEAFRLVKGEGLSLTEVADRLGETSMAIRLRAHRATQAVRQSLEEQWGLPTQACGARRCRPAQEAHRAA